MSGYYKATEVDDLLNKVGKGNCNLCAFYDDCNFRGLNRKGSHRYCWQVMRFPPADVVEIKHAQWQKYYKSGTTVSDGFVSSCCDMWNERKTPYCPNCDAKMDGERKDKE
nr:MAG TPA: 50S ribosomal protein L19 [Caudoviricetes sp.]